MKRVSPVARRIAQEMGVDLSRVTGTGPDGRILRRDVEAAASAAPATPAAAAAPAAPRPAAQAPAWQPAAAPAGEDVVQIAPLTRMRETIARRMVQSKTQAPHYYLEIEVDMTDALAMRQQVNAVLGEAGRASVNDVIVLATAKALARHPRFNAWWVDDNLQLHSRISIGIAVALDDGLVVPALIDVGNRGLGEIAQMARDVADRARSGRLRPEEYAAPTFSISNLGAYGVDILTAIINPPQVGVLGIGAVREKPVVRDGEIVVRSMMAIVLSADHRATNGAEGAQFLATLRQLLETPSLMLL
jgi:pyruvate dehydrogenase E2 component (dihydrolipoamide acetyltransferase)